MRHKWAKEFQKLKFAEGSRCWTKGFNARK